MNLVFDLARLVLCLISSAVSDDSRLGLYIDGWKVTELHRVVTADVARFVSARPVARLHHTATIYACR